MIDVVPELPSTQDELISRLSRSGSEWGHLRGLRARVQSAGRGRGDRVWSTDGVRALTVSYVLRPAAPMEQWGTLALRGGLAAVRALARVGVEVSLKWPNDVVIETANDTDGWYGIAKVGGVLGTITRDSDGVDACVLGIGANLDGETHLASAATLGTAVPAQELALLIREELATLVPAEGETLPPIDQLMAEHCHTIGKNVIVSFPGEGPPREIRGRAVGVDSSGALIVEGPEGAERVVHGDIGHTRLDPTVSSGS